MAPTKLCMTGFVMFEDSANDDTHDTTLTYEKSSGSSNEGDKHDRPISSMDVSNHRSGEKRRSDSSKSKEMRTRIFAKEFSAHLIRLDP